jgi:hypothetical protein
VCVCARVYECVPVSMCVLWRLRYNTICRYTIVTLFLIKADQTAGTLQLDMQLKTRAGQNHLHTVVGNFTYVACFFTWSVHDKHSYTQKARLPVLQGGCLTCAPLIVGG